MRKYKNINEMEGARYIWGEIQLSGVKQGWLKSSWIFQMYIWLQIL